MTKKNFKILTIVFIFAFITEAITLFIYKNKAIQYQKKLLLLQRIINKLNNRINLLKTEQQIYTNPIYLRKLAKIFNWKLDQPIKSVKYKNIKQKIQSINQNNRVML